MNCLTAHSSNTSTSPQTHRPVAVVDVGHRVNMQNLLRGDGQSGKGLKVFFRLEKEEIGHDVVTISVGKSANSKGRISPFILSLEVFKIIYIWFINLSNSGS